MRGYDFVHDAAIMSLACHGEIASGLFVLFMTAVPRLFNRLRGLSWGFPPRRHTSNRPNAPNAPNADIESTASRGMRFLTVRNGGRSLWHITWDRNTTMEQGMRRKGDDDMDDDAISVGSLESNETTLTTPCANRF
jgi:hypothetical protein